jgi:hypothetical protein
MCHRLLDRSAVHPPTQRIALFFTIFENSWIMIFRRPSTHTIRILDNPAAQVFFRMAFFLLRGTDVTFSYNAGMIGPLIKFETTSPT